ncbi:MAG: substrate-binding protein [Acetobacteraceae bacterium]
MQPERDLKATRRQALKLSGAGLLGGAIGSGLGGNLSGGLGEAFVPAAEAAEHHAPVGTWPKGVSGKTAFIGLSPPLTGTYGVPGHDELRGYQLAIEHLNDGDPLMRAFAPKVTKGLLGKKVIYGVGDSQAHPNVAIQVQSKFISNNNAILMSGQCTSAVAIALEKLGQREKVIYITGISGSNDTTGKECVRYGFRCSFYAHMSAAALAPALIKAFGKNKKAAYLTPDYTFGTTVQHSTELALKKGGWTTVTNQLPPLGTSDFSSYLLNIANSGADFVIDICWGNDAVASIKQMAQFGIPKKMTLVIAYQTPFLARDVTPELTQGVYAATDWWWTLQDKYPLAKQFVEKFEKKFGYKPDMTANEAYLDIASWARMVSNAGTFYPPSVIKEWEKGEHYDSTVGEVWFRPENHQMIRPVFVQRGKKPSEMKSKDDYWEIVDTVPGPETVQAVGAFGCHLGAYT